MVLMSRAEQVDRGLEWYDVISDERRREAFRELIEFAITADWVSVCDEDLTPFFLETGEPIA